MELFRIARKRYIRDLSGEGARRYGGRWNHKGVAVLYTSPTASLAALEMLVNTSVASLPNDLQLMVLSVPDSIPAGRIDMNRLPGNWSGWPSPEPLMNIGSDWIAAQSSLLLFVPSAVIPTEWNVLINPGHPDIENVKQMAVHDFRFDKRFRE
ncbi:MAG: RES family NAD+ phosphorylase [Balneolaceae bacterium]